jgi:hypothetical protein
LTNQFQVKTVIPLCRQSKKKTKNVFNEAVNDDQTDNEQNNGDENDDDDDDESEQGKGNPKRKSKVQQPLTCIQYSEARICTKVRSVVERVFATLKKNKAIDRVRNSVLGHLRIDLRIAAAFYNLTFKPLIDDKDHSEAVARRLKQKLNLRRDNNLEILFRSRMSTRRYFSCVNIRSIDDFIPLKRRYLRQKVYCGSFHLKMAKSYLFDFMTITQAYVYKPPKYLLHLIEPNSKILAFKVSSRYKRSKSKLFISKGKQGIDQFNKVNKVFLHYTPWAEMYEDEKRSRLKKGVKKCDAIKGYICSCLNGRRLAGTCSHVATVIYYLAWAKRHIDRIKFPGEYLKEIFVQNHKKPNKPM